MDASESDHLSEFLSPVDKTQIGTEDLSNLHVLNESFPLPIDQSFKDIIFVDTGDNINLNRLFLIVPTNDELGAGVVESPVPLSDTQIKEILTNNKCNDENETLVETIDIVDNDNDEKIAETININECDGDSLKYVKSLDNESNGDYLKYVNSLDNESNGNSLKYVNSHNSESNSLNLSSSSLQFLNEKPMEERLANLKSLLSKAGKCRTKKSAKLNHKLDDYSCPICEYKFSSSYSLDCHIRSVHEKEKRFSCHLCGNEFFRMYDLQMHYRVHLNIKRYICHYCGNKFNNSSNLNRHHRVHSKIKPYVCDICGIRFSQIPPLLYHKVRHKTDGSCIDCEAEFHSFYGLKNHMSQAHKKDITLKSLYAMFCKDTNDNSSRKYNCIFCGKLFVFKKELELHEKEKHSYDSFPCKNCFIIFPTLSEFKVHSCNKDNKNKESYQIERLNADYRCCKCLLNIKGYLKAESHICKLKEKNFEQLLNVDKISISKEESNEGLVIMNISTDENGSPIHSSSQSNKDFNDNSHQVTINLPSDKLTIKSEKLSSYSSNNTINNQDNHNTLSSTNTIQGINPKQTIKKRNKPNIDAEKRINSMKHKTKQKQTLFKCSSKKHKTKQKQTLFECSYCPKTFKRGWNLRQHVATHDPSLRKYKCAECNQTYSYMSSYTNHLLNHSTDRPQIKCSQCSKVFKTNRCLNQHIRRIHEKLRPFSCTLCSKAFFDKSVYSYHMRIHNQEHPYVCSSCGKGFAHSSHLYRHERTHNRERSQKSPEIQDIEVVKEEIESVGNIGLDDDGNGFEIVNTESSYCTSSFIPPSSLPEHLQKHQNNVTEPNNVSSDESSHSKSENDHRRTQDIVQAEGNDTAISIDDMLTSGPG